MPDNSISEKELISVIVPVFNTAKYLNRCVDSILNQTYDHIEVILVDDGSTDGVSGKICDEYSEMDCRIRVIHKNNGGLSSARNAGLDDAKGGYISFIDSDDEIKPDFLQKLYDRIQFDGSDVAFCEFKALTEEGDIIIDSKERGFDGVLSQDDFWDIVIRDDGSVNGTVSSCTKLYKAYIWYELRFPEGKIHEDEFVLYDVISSCGTISALSDKKYIYYQNVGSIMHSRFDIKKLDSCEAIFKRAEMFLRASQNEYAVKSYIRSLRDLKAFVRQIDVDQRKSERLADIRKLRSKLFVPMLCKARFRDKIRLIKYNV